MNKTYPQNHKVAVLHKCESDSDGLPDGNKLARGKCFVFPASGARYVVTETGAVRNPDKSRLNKKKRLRLKAILALAEEVR